MILGEDGVLPRPWPCSRGKTWTANAGLAKCEYSCFQACEIVQRPGKKTPPTPSVIYLFNRKLCARIPFPHIHIFTHTFTVICNVYSTQCICKVVVMIPFYRYGN